jgi:hypothetical protein
VLSTKPGQLQIVKSFSLVPAGQPGLPAVSNNLVSICGRCGALIAPGFEVQH